MHDTFCFAIVPDHDEIGLPSLTAARQNLPLSPIPLGKMLIPRDRRSRNVFSVAKPPLPDLAACINTLTQFHVSIV